MFKQPNNGWSDITSYTAKFTVDEGNDEDNVGESVSISSDGSLILVGANGNDAGKGAAYVFKQPNGGWSGDVTTYTTKLTASDGKNGDILGSSVSFCSTTNTALAGAPWAPYTAETAGPGAVYLYQLSPKSTTASTSNISNTSVTVSGTIISSETVLDYGMCYGTRTNPTYCVSKLGTTSSVSVASNVSTSSASLHFTMTLSGLSAGTQYYFRTYATNTYGTSYGDNKTFTTITGGGDDPAQVDAASPLQYGILILLLAGIALAVLQRKKVNPCNSIAKRFKGKDPYDGPFF